MVELQFLADCALAQSQPAPGTPALRFPGLQIEDRDGRHCVAALPREQFDQLFGMCALSGIQLRADQADNYLCVVNYSPWEARFEYRHRSGSLIRPLCMFACTRAR